MVLLFPLAQQAVGDGLQEVADSQGDFFIVHRHPHANAVDAQVMENGSGLAPERREQDSVSKSLSFLCPLGLAGTKKLFSSVNPESVQGRVLISSHCSQTTQTTAISRSLGAKGNSSEGQSTLSLPEPYVLCTFLKESSRLPGSAQDFWFLSAAAAS